MRELIVENKLLLEWMGGLSVVAFVGSLFAVPWFLARIPSDYLCHHSRSKAFCPHLHPAIRWPAIVVKNLIGVVLVLCGIAMLVLPGQGLLTIGIGLMAIDFPGRQALVHSMIGRPHVFKAINWIRRRAHQPPLVKPDGVAEEAHAE